MEKPGWRSPRKAQTLSSLPPLLDIVLDKLLGIFLQDVVDFVDQFIHFFLELFAAFDDFRIGLGVLLGLRTTALRLGFLFLLVHGTSSHARTPPGASAGYDDSQLTPHHNGGQEYLRAGGHPPLHPPTLESLLHPPSPSLPIQAFVP